MTHHSQYDLSWRTCEPRACQRVDLEIGPGRTLHVYNVHLGTAVLERRYQAPRLASYVHDRRVTAPKIILGDFNEWMRGLATQTLNSLFESIDIRAHLRRRRTYPGIFPVLHLDHIYYEGQVEVRKPVDAPHSPRADGVGSSAARGGSAYRVLRQTRQGLGLRARRVLRFGIPGSQLARGFGRARALRIVAARGGRAHDTESLYPTRTSNSERWMPATSPKLEA